MYVVLCYVILAHSSAARVQHMIDKRKKQRHWFIWNKLT